MGQPRKTGPTARGPPVILTDTGEHGQAQTINHPVNREQGNRKRSVRYGTHNHRQDGGC